MFFSSALKTRAYRDHVTRGNFEPFCSLETIFMLRWVHDAILIIFVKY